MNGSARVIRADSRSLPLADNSVDLVVTSPPYFALRSYTDNGVHYERQIGAEATPEEFVTSLLEVTAECVRVLKPTGSLWVNLGDKYSSGGRSTYDLDPGRREVAAMRAQDGMRPKTLIGIPWRYALRCIDDLGLILRAEVIWSKPNGLPESVTDRVRRSHEQWFHFTLQPRYFSAVDEIREPHLDMSAHAMKRGERHSEYKTAKLGAHTLTSTNNPLGKLPGSVWTIPTEPLRVPEHLGVDHFAAFPTEWPRRIIAGWSPAGVCVACGEGRRPVVDKVRRNFPANSIVGYGCACIGKAPDANAEGGKRHSDHLTASGERLGNTLPPTTPAVILDPFGGTGTTALVAKALGRHGITVDMSADYCRLAQWRTNDPDQLAKAARKEKPPVQTAGQLDLLGDDAA